MASRGRRSRGRLTDLMVRQAGSGRHSDNFCGLQLLVRPSGARSFVQRIVIDGDRRDLGLGSYPLVSLEQAREKAFENRRAVRQGLDPTAVRDQDTTPAVRAVVDQVIAARRSGWNNPDTEKKWRRLFKTLVFPRIGDKPIRQVTLSDLTPIIVPAWKGRGSTGYILRQHLVRVFEWAIAHGYRQDNPAAQTKGLLPNIKATMNHHPSLPYAQAPQAIAELLRTSNDDAAKLLLVFLVLCASRFSEAAEATWSEIASDKTVWTLPAERMKARRPHRVPLSEQAVELLDRMRALSRPGAFIFPAASKRGGARPVTRAAVSRLLRSLDRVDEQGRPVVMHGFRATFRVWAMECTRETTEVCEAALAHVESDQTVAAYARSDVFERRRKLMQDWADYVLPRSVV